MDPVTAFGIATGVTGLLPLCARGFTVNKEVIQADRKLRDITTAWEVEDTRYVTFQKSLDLENVREEDVLKALKSRAPEIQHAVILKCLAAISNIFADPKVLARYGLRHNVDDLEMSKDQASTKLPLEAAEWKGKEKQFVQERKTRMGFFRRSRLVLQDSIRIKGMILEIKTYLDGLFSNCTYLQMQAYYTLTFTNIMIPDMLAMGNVMERMEQLFASQKNNPDPQQRAAYDLLKRTAHFAASVKATRSQAFVALQKSNFQFSGQLSWAVSNNVKEIGTMALWDHNPRQDKTQVYYVEWRSVGDGTIDKELEANVMSLAKIASLREVPEELRVLPCLGAFKLDYLRYGLVYQLPSHIRNFDRTQAIPGDLSRRRKPYNLLAFLSAHVSRIPVGLDLGSRIKLAQRLAQSLLLLHSVKWVHKNFCSESIIFFRASSTTGDLPSTTGRIAFDQPYICGFDQSRPDEKTIIARAHSGTTYLKEQLSQTRANIYQHPHKRENPQTRYLSKYDVYSLGCVMLEIGLWQSLSSLVAEFGNKSAYKIRDYLVEIAETELPGQVGWLYADATTRCLQTSQMDNGEEDSKATLQYVIEELGRCVV